MNPKTQFKSHQSVDLPPAGRSPPGNRPTSMQHTSGQGSSNDLSRELTTWNNRFRYNEYVLCVILHSVLKNDGQQRRHIDFITHQKIFVTLESSDEMKQKCLRSKQLVEEIKATVGAIITLETSQITFRIIYRIIVSLAILNISSACHKVTASFTANCRICVFAKIYCQRGSISGKLSEEGVDMHNNLHEISRSRASKVRTSSTNKPPSEFIVIILAVRKCRKHKHLFRVVEVATGDARLHTRQSDNRPRAHNETSQNRRFVFQF